MEVVLSFIVLLVLGLVIVGAVFIIQRVRRGEGVSLSLRQVLAFYFYVMTVVTLLVAFSGLSRLVQAGLSVPLGREFSYYPVYYPEDYPVPVRLEAPPAPVVAPTPSVAPTVAPPEEGPIAEEEEARRQKGLDQAFKEGILGGLNFTVVGGFSGWSTSGGGVASARTVTCWRTSTSSACSPFSPASPFTACLPG